MATVRGSRAVVGWLRIMRVHFASERATDPARLHACVTGACDLCRLVFDPCFFQLVDTVVGNFRTSYMLADNPL
jgi:hypothetical protein